jgi:hypothetical protein
MLKGLTSGKGTVVSGGNYGYPYIPMNSTNPIQGMLRLNNQDMQVFDGSSWITVGASYASVDLDVDTQSLLEWARTERTRQNLRLERIRNNPALQKAYEAIQRAEANFDILDKIVGDDLDAELRELAP